MLYYNSFWKKDYFSSQKYQNLVLLTIVANKNIRTINKNLFFSTLGYDLWNSYYTIDILVLKYHLK